MTQCHGVTNALGRGICVTNVCTNWQYVTIIWKKNWPKDTHTWGPGNTDILVFGGKKWGVCTII